MARYSQWVTGVDACRTAIDDARINAARAELANLNFRMGIAHKALVRVFQTGARFDRVFLHGMRRPFGPRAMAVIRAIKPEKVVYIGPSSRSLAEDMDGLPEYAMTRLGGLDQTPGTTTILNVALMERTMSGYPAPID